MGQCIASMADGANSRQIVSSDMYRDYADYGLQCAALPGTEGDNHSPIYRMSNMDSGEYEDLCKRWSSSSCARLMEQMCTERKDKVMLAHRKMIRMENKIIVDERTKKEKSMNVHIFDPTRISISYAEFWRRVIAFGRGLRTLGVGKGAKVALYEETRWEWLTSMFGCWTQGIVVSTVYANLGEDALIYALCETECQAIVCNHSNVEKLVALFEKHGLDQTIIIYLDELPAGVDTKDMTVAKWNDVMTAGSSRKGMRFEARIPQDEEAVKEDALIMYTSGTTGNPKGVVHSHASLYCGVMSIAHRVEDVLGPQKEDEWYCSYLPLAHILEFALTMVLLQRGMSVGYGSPRTLTDQFAHPHGDFTEYRPFLVAAVPRVYDTIKKAVEARLPKPGTLKRTIYDNAYRSRLKALHEGNDTPYYNRKVFSVPRALLGGRAQVIFSGGGPLSASTQEFLNVVFGMVSQGWGLTETVCCGGIQRLGNMESDSVGQIIRSVEVKLVDTEEFKHTDKPNPRGEIYVRGPFLFKGYYKQPTLTQEAIDADGWFHTGDVASITDSGALRIVGRVKALAKNANGEYLALETLESIYGNNELCLPNSCCVLVNPHRNYIALLALTSEELVEEFKRKYRISCPKFPEALEDPNFQREALKSFQNSARAAGRRPFEVIQQIKLLKDEWTAENGVLTAAMKLKRRRIDECYADDIKQLFKQE